MSPDSAPHSSPHMRMMPSCMLRHDTCRLKLAPSNTSDSVLQNHPNPPAHGPGLIDAHGDDEGCMAVGLYIGEAAVKEIIVLR